MFVAISWNALWRYCAKGRRLLREDVTDAEAQTITRQYLVAPLGSVVAIAICLVSGLSRVTAVLVIAGFYSFTGSHRSWGRGRPPAPSLDFRPGFGRA